jgi:azobenzene reductase
MKILVINGSATKESNTRKLSQTVINLLKKSEVEVTYFDVGKDMLPIFTGSEEEKGHPMVQKLSTLADQADGFFICTPEYHNGISGALKNALDFLGGKHFRGKPIAIAAAAGGGKGGINALNNLRLVMRGVYGLVLPDQFIADPNCFNDSYEIGQEDAKGRLKNMVEELVRITGLLSKKPEKVSI